MWGYLFLVAYILYAYYFSIKNILIGLGKVKHENYQSEEQIKKALMTGILSIIGVSIGAGIILYIFLRSIIWY